MVACESATGWRTQESHCVLRVPGFPCGFKARIARRFFGPALAEKATSRLYVCVCTCVCTCHARDYAGRRTTLHLVFFFLQTVPQSSVYDVRNLCARIILETLIYSIPKAETPRRELASLFFFFSLYIYIVKFVLLFLFLYTFNILFVIKPY